MNGGQVTLNMVTDEQLETLLDVKKNNEGQFQLVSLTISGQPGQPVQPGCNPQYFPGSPWGPMAHGPLPWYGPSSPFGPFPPGMQAPPPPPQPQPQTGQTTYNVVLTWDREQGLKAISAVLDRLKMPG